eukprot:scaffold2822_cov176-Pinguiococcus_pyrenoidosus.AAC.1
MLGEAARPRLCLGTVRVHLDLAGGQSFPQDLAPPALLLKTNQARQLLGPGLPAKVQDPLRGVSQLVGLLFDADLEQVPKVKLGGTASRGSPPRRRRRGDRCLGLSLPEGAPLPLEVANERVDEALPCIVRAPEVGLLVHSHLAHDLLEDVVIQRSCGLPIAELVREEALAEPLLAVAVEEGPELARQVHRARCRRPHARHGGGSRGC